MRRLIDSCWYFWASCANIFFLQFVGFTPENISRELPAVQHVNKDGLLPMVDVRLTAKKSKVDFFLCHKTAFAETSNTFTDALSPFVVLSGQAVGARLYCNVINEIPTLLENGFQSKRFMYFVLRIKSGPRVKICRQ